MRKLSRKRRGMVLGIVAVVAAFVFLLVFNMTMFSQGEMAQLARSEHLVTCELATRSAYHRQVNELRVRPWGRRSFAAGPLRLTESRDRHELDILIEDTPGQERSADLWVSVARGKVRRLVFWRVRVTESVFQKINEVQPVNFTFLDPDRFGIDRGRDEVRTLVDAALAERERKSRERELLTRKILDKRQFGAVMSELGIPVLGAAMDVQTPFSPGAGVGYTDAPLRPMMADYRSQGLTEQGAMSVEDFAMVQTRDALPAEFLARMTRQLGEERSVALLQQMSKLERAAPLLPPDGGGDFLPEDTDNLLAAIVAPSLGDDAEPKAGTDGDNTPPAGEEEEAPVSSVAPIDGGIAWLPTETPAVSPPPLVVDPPTSPSPPPPAVTGGSVFSFEELMRKRDIYDENFERIWGNTRFRWMRTVAAYSNQSLLRNSMKYKLESGTATLKDFENYVRANKTYSRYTKVSYWADRAEGKRDDIVRKAEKYFAERLASAHTAGVPVDSEGNPVN